MHFHIINHEHANIPQLSDLTAVEQFDLPCPLIKQGDSGNLFCS